MTKRDLTISKSKGKWIKRQLGQILEDFDSYNSHKLREKLDRLARQVDPIFSK